MKLELVSAIIGIWSRFRTLRNSKVFVESLKELNRFISLKAQQNSWNYPFLNLDQIPIIAETNSKFIPKSELSLHIPS